MTLIRPVVTYGCGVWTLPVRDVNSLLVFERHTLRGLYGPFQCEEGWRISNGDELEKLVRGEIILTYKRAQRIKWPGHLDRKTTKTARMFKECVILDFRQL